MNVVHIRCTEIVNSRFFVKVLLFTVRLYNEDICLHGRGEISNLFSRPLHDFTGCVPNRVLIIFFCRVDIFLLSGELPPRSSQYSIIEFSYTRNFKQTRFVHIYYLLEEILGL
jgi:hypothetical protein